MPRLRQIPEQSAALVEWFDACLVALREHPAGLTHREWVEWCAKQEIELGDGTPADVHSADFMVQVASAAEELRGAGFIRITTSMAITESSRLVYPIDTITLTARGQAAQQWPRWRRRLWLGLSLARGEIARLFVRWKLFLTVASVVFTITKLALQWNTLVAAGSAIAAALVAAATLAFR